jgi:hypothetical protein
MKYAALILAFGAGWWGGSHTSTPIDGVMLATPCILEGEPI